MTGELTGAQRAREHAFVADLFEKLLGLARERLLVTASEEIKIMCLRVAVLGGIVSVGILPGGGA